MTVVLMTGFPGFLGSALLPRLLARRTHARALALVQSQHVEAARRRIAEIESVHPHTRGASTSSRATSPCRASG
jgi:thioester reductase-like protein